MEQLFNGSPFMPHGYCLKWDPLLLSILVAGNLMIVGAYYSIPAALVSLIRKRQDVVFHWMFKLFAVFIFLCGTTHLIKVLTIWQPYYWLEASLDFLTGLVSVATAILLWPLIPKAAILPNPTKLSLAYEKLKSEMKKREEAEQRISLLASIVDWSQDAIISFRSDGTVISWNRAAQDLFGYSVEGTIGKTLKHLIGIDLETIYSAFKDDRKLDPIEFSYTRADGTTFFLSASVSPIKEDEKNPASGMAIFRDITQTRQTMQELKVTTEQLASSNKELEEFAWIAAHDLKEPVRTMATYSKMLLQEYAEVVEEEGKQFLNYIHEASAKAMDRIDAVLKFGSIREEKMDMEPVDLSSILDNVLKDLDKAVTDSRCKVEVGSLPVINGRPDYLYLLFQNLISNAIKYRGSNDPEIAIDSKKENDYWIVSVKDNGIGFNMDNAEKIFRMFQRLHSDAEYPGAGLGLSLCKKIVELHRGKIWAESEEGKGSTFFFQLPAVEESENE